MKRITILATIAILAGAALFTTTASPTFISAQAQTPADNATMMGNMTGGNMTGGNSTEAVGSVSNIDDPFAPG